MTTRLEIDRLLRQLYAARVAGDLDGVCQTFANDARFEIAGTSQTSPIAISATGLDQIRTWLALLIKTFQMSDHTILSMIIDDAAAAVHWRAKIRSRITGATVPTDLVDLVQIREGRIANYTEFFVPR
jgi:ketosteroid isomerase-like protein